MSSVTDPYQPIERKLELVRELLTVLVQHQPRLVIQTRSPLVTRDSDLFQQFDTIQVNMTVTTDSDEIRKAFEPQCPSNKQRIDAASELVKAGIDTVITMTPLLPIKSAEQFAARLLKSGVQRFVVQPFHPERGKFVRGTRDEALNLIKSFDWDQAHYERAVAVLMRKLPMLNEGQTGFAPPV